MAIGSSLNFLPEGLQSQALYPKLCDMIDHIVTNFETELVDVQSKFRGPSVVRQEVIEQVINELGFNYITNVMGTISNFEFNQLLQFLSLINLLKGSRNGLELVLKLLGFDSIITEWWENAPLKPADTFDLTVIVNTSFVLDLNATVEQVKIFTRHYVFPTLDVIDFRFAFALASKNVTMAGFAKPKYAGAIIQRI